MSTRVYRFKYQVSDRTLLEWPRRLQVRAFGLDTALDASLPRLTPDSDGILLRCVSLPAALPTVELTTHYGDTLLRYVLQRFPRYFIDMAGQDFEGYTAKFSSKTRSTLTRKVRKFRESCGGALRWECFADPDGLERFWQLARQVSKKTYQEQLLDAGLPDDAGYRDRALSLATQNNLRAFLLFDGEQAVSYLFCPIRDGVIQYAYLGYDPAYHGLSVGTVLQWLALESLFAEKRYRYFDFTEGESEHKRLFSTGHLQCANVALLRPTWTHRLLVASHRGFTHSVEALGGWLEQHNLKRRIRRWLRFGRLA